MAGWWVKGEADLQQPVTRKAETGEKLSLMAPSNEPHLRLALDEPRLEGFSLTAGFLLHNQARPAGCGAVMDLWATDG